MVIRNITYPDSGYHNSNYPDAGYPDSGYQNSNYPDSGYPELHLSGIWLSGTPLIRTLVIAIANYPEQLDPSGKFVEISTKLTCLEITGYRIKYSRVLWLLELQIRSGRKIQTQEHTVNSNSRT